MIIYGEKINIRAIEHDDLEFLREIKNSPELERMENGFDFPISSAMQKQWYEDIYLKKNPGQFIIETKEHQRLGYACLLNIDWKNRSAHMGLKLSNDCEKRQGYGFDTINTMMRYAFDELQLHRLDGFIIEYNIASRNLFIKKCGWKEEGVKRQAVYKNGSYHDLLMVAILKKDWLCNTKKKNDICLKDGSRCQLKH